MSQKTLNLCLERYNFVKFGETTKSSHTVLCINNAYSVNSDKYRLTPAAIASKHGEGYVFTMNYDFDRPLFTIVQKSYALDGTSGNIVFEGIDPISKGGSKYLRKVTVSPVKLSDGSYLLEVTNDEYLRIGTTGAALGDEELESLNEKIVTMGGIEKSVETVGGKQVLKLDAGGPSGAKEIVYFDIDPSDPPSGLYNDIGTVLSNNKLPAIRSDGKLYMYSSTGTDRYVFVGVFSTDGVGYEEFSVYTDDNVQADKHNASLGYAALPSSGTEEHPAWAKVCELEPKPQQTYTTYGLALLFTAEHPSDDGKNTESGILAIDVGSDWFTNSNCCNASWMAYTPGNEYSKILGVKLIGKYGVPSDPTRAPYPVYKVEVWVKYYGSHNILVNALQNAMYFTGMVQGDFFKFPEGHIAIPQSTEPSYADTEEYKYKNFFYPAESPSVAYTYSQSLTSDQKAQGRDNIGAASASDVTALQSQVSSLSDVSAYSVKGEATVAQLNAGPSGIQAGWAYQLTDSGTLIDGSLAVVAGDTVAWDGTKWFPLVKSDYYATKTYAQNVAHSIAPEFDPTRTSENPYKAGETVTYTDGKTYTFKVDHYGAWASADVEEVFVYDGKFVYSSDLKKMSLPLKVYSGQGQPLNYNIGATVSLSPISAEFWSSVVDCAPGELFYVKAHGRETCRSYGFVDSSNKLLYKSGAEPIDTVVRVPVSAAKLIFNNSWSNDDFVLAKVETDVNKLVDNRVSIQDIKALSQSVAVNYSQAISLNYRVGTVVSLTPISLNFSSAVVVCTAGDLYYIKSTGTSGYRSYGFLDADNRLLYKSESGLVDRVVRIPEGCTKLVYNNSNSYESSIFSKVSVTPSVISEITRNDFSLHEVETAGLVELPWQPDRYLTIGDVGSVQSYISSASSSHNKLLVIDCVKGQKFIVTGHGPSTARAWAFVDSDDIVVAKSDASATLSNESVIAPCDGKFISTLDSTGVVKTVNLYGRIDKLSNVSDDLKDFSTYKYDYHEWTHNGFVRVNNISVGDTIDETDYSSGGSYKQLKVTCNPGDVFTIYGTSAISFRRYIFIDANDVVLAMDAANQSPSTITVTAPLGTVRAIFETVNSDQYYVERVDVDKTVSKIGDVLAKQYPLVSFDFEKYIPDATESGNFDFSKNEQNLITILEQVQDAFDALALAHPNLITKYDAYEYADVEYPEYADGVETEGTYKVTPYYRTYMYKIGMVNSQTPIERKKVLFVAGTHGQEIAAPVNAYLFFKKMCETEGSDLFKMLSLYDFYVVPCLNGYGMYHATKGNGNKVNINRNYPIAKWSESGQDTKDTDYSSWTGPSAGSEAETQLVMALAESIKPDLLIDHHNYSANTEGSSILFYVSSFTDELNRVMYNAQADITSNLKVKKPTIFGSEYGLLPMLSNYWYTTNRSNNVGTASRWGYESMDVKFSTTFEISACLPVNTGWYGTEVFEIGGYMLRAFMTHYLDYIQDK